MSDSNNRPSLLVFAGPNGSGKTTIKKYFDIKGTYTNADDIVAATGMDNLSAAKLVNEMRYSSIKHGEDFTFETVLSSNYPMDIIRKATEAGYFVKCVFVLTVDPMLNVRRVQSRVADGGHDVDRDKIISRYYSSLANIKNLMSLCDILHIYDNTDNNFRILRKHKEIIDIFPNKYWSESSIISLAF